METLTLTVKRLPGFLLCLASSVACLEPSLNKAPDSVTPEVTTAAILSQPTYGVKNVTLSDDLRFNFLNSNSLVQTPPLDSAYSILAYSDPTCSAAATGAFTYTRTTSANDVRLTNIRYSKAEDIYVGIKGTNISKACSSSISLVSSVPTNFIIQSGSGQTGVVNTNLAIPIVFKIFDAVNNLVQNARIRIGTQVSSASDANGLASMTLKGGTAVGAWGFIPSTDLNTYSAILLYGGVLVDSKDLEITLLPGTATSLVVTLQDPASISLQDVSNSVVAFQPIFLTALDRFSNVVHSSDWNFTWATYTNPTCTTPGPAVFDFTVLGNNEDPTDPSTWFNLFFYSYDQVGSFYLKFTLSAPNSGSVCSNLITVTP